LMRDEVMTPNTLEVLMPNVDAAAAVAERLKALPEVRQVLTIRSFIPADQDAKLEMIGDAGAILLASLSPPKSSATPDPAITTRTVDETVRRLHELPNASPAAKRLGQILSSLTAQGADGLAIMQRTLITGLPALLDSLRDALSATRVAFANLPDDLK